jgi:hypothetical protein
MQAKRADANANALSGEKLSFEAGAWKPNAFDMFQHLSFG